MPIQELGRAVPEPIGLKSHIRAVESAGKSVFRADLKQSTPNEGPFMKFFSLTTERTHRRAKLDKPSRGTLESFTKPTAVSHQIHTYTELRQRIHDDLRIQHPEWVQPNGKCPTCDSYEARLMELLDPLTRRGSNESIAASHRALEQGLNRIAVADQGRQLVRVL